MKPLNLINKMLPKKSNRIVLYSNLGFRDNVKYLYDYLIENKYNEKYEIICSIDDFEKHNQNIPKNTRFIGNKKGLAYFLTSKYFFYSFGKFPIYPTKRQLVFNLWHGMPLKKIGLLEEENKNNKYDYFTYVLATSSYFSEHIEKAFGCKRDRVFICGQPRTDRFFTERQVNKNLFSKKEFEKYLLWMPTFRFSEKLNVNNTSAELHNGLPLFGSNNELEKLNEKLRDLNACIIIKLHPMQTDLLKNNTEYSNIIFINEEWFTKNQQDLYSIVKFSDALITDYSSIYFDYLLLNKPIGFTLDDLDDYKKNRGFIIENPLEIMPGEKIYSKENFYHFLNSVSHNEDNFFNERNKINNLLNRGSDGEHSKKILDFCGIEKNY